jgi:putative membrane protein
MWPEHGAHMSWMWLWWVLGFAVLVLVIWTIARLATPAGPRGEDSPEAILKGRYARGEITQEEYERRLATLRR